MKDLNDNKDMMNLYSVEVLKTFISDKIFTDHYILHTVPSDIHKT